MRPPSICLLLCLIALCHSDEATSIRDWLIESCASGSDHGFTLRIGASAFADTRLIAVRKDGVHVQATGLDADLPWKALGEDGLYQASVGLVATAPIDVAVATLALGRRLGRQGDPAWAKAFDQLQRRDLAAASRVDPPAPAPAPTPAPAPPSAAVSTPAATEDGQPTTDAVPAEEMPKGLSDWDRLTDRSGRIVTATYIRRAIGLDAADINRRLGPDWAFFHRQAKGPAKPAAEPELPMRFADGAFLYKTGKEPKDYTGMAGQVVYVPTAPKNPGMDRLRFTWSNHENHGGSQFWHQYLLAPTMAEWYCASPDPGLQRTDWQQVNGPLQRPLAIARGRVEWSNCAIMAFANGVVGASGYGNNEDRYPFTTLPPGKMPTAVAVTPNNEFALITVWDAQERKAQMAVLALEARALAHHSWWYAGLPNVGTYTRIKLLGLVDLPGMAAPTAIAATGDVLLWRWTTPVSGERLDDAALRRRWAAGADPEHRACSDGFAVIASRSENKLLIMDLQPLFAYMRTMYFGSDADFARTRNEGPAADAWPCTFATAPQARPRPLATLAIPAPSALAIGADDGGWDQAVNRRIFAATMDGRLVTIQVSRRTQTAAPEAKVVATLAVGRNPTHIAWGRNASLRHDLLVVTCRGDRQLAFITNLGAEPTLSRVLRDRRLTDPVACELWETRGAAGLTVADFAGGKLVNYLYEPIVSWGDRLYGGLGPSGDAPFECTGVLAIPGLPYALSSAEVN